MAESTPNTPDTSMPPSLLKTIVLGLSKLVLVILSLIGCALLAVVLVFAAAYPNLPDVSNLLSYRPKLPLRVYSAEGALLAEFGEERREFTAISDIPNVMQQAVLAAEDARFFDHHGVDYLGMVRAGLANFGKSKSQGASTISMQVARNVYLSAEKTYTRKIYEILLTFKLEQQLSKHQILEIYMNHIFLGHRAYGFTAAAQVYFGKALKDVSIAEAAMLAGLPKAPSAFNPFSNPQRAKIRQHYIIDRMLENGFITQTDADAAKQTTLQLKKSLSSERVRGDYVAEMVRQAVVAQYGEEAYTRGLSVTTTIRSGEQQAAYRALRQGLMDFERRQVYRGPEKFVTLPNDKAALEESLDELLAEYPDNGDVFAAVVLEASTKRVVVARQDGQAIEISGEGLKPVQSGLSDKAAPQIKIRRGAVVRIMQHPKMGWHITQLPEVEGAFVALDPRNGAIRALVGGFDFQKNKFNHATQAWRQPGSSFKPFIYSAALEKGVHPATVVDDGPLFFSAAQTGGKPWEPKNYDGKFDGPMSVRTALARSKNMVSIRILQVVGAKEAQEWVGRFGFDPLKHPPYLTMALGAGAVTPLQMASAYGVFATGGHLVPPMLISRIADHQGNTILETQPQTYTEAQRVIESRNAFIMGSLLQEITRSGTAARAQSTLKRPDLYGKTGTTNDAMDAWFVGYHPTVVAAVWVGYDNPRNLGSRETGGGLSLPIWIGFMQEALKQTPVVEMQRPDTVVQMGDWRYAEYAYGIINSLGVEQTLDASGAQDTHSPANPTTPSAGDERKGILDLFRQ